jgi:hypothetical protein
MHEPHRTSFQTSDVDQRRILDAYGYSLESGNGQTYTMRETTATAIMVTAAELPKYVPL